MIIYYKSSIVIKEVKNNKCQIIDLAAPSDRYFSKGIVKKLSKHKD